MKLMVGRLFSQIGYIKTTITTSHYMTKKVREVCDERKSKGEVWGIEGFVIGDLIGTSALIQRYVFEKGSNIAFDYPGRTNVVQVIGSDENGQSALFPRHLEELYWPPSKKGYSYNGTEEVYPIAFLGNPKLWRLSNLIRQRYGFEKDDQRLWGRLRIAAVSMALYNGPISMMYGDEIGMMTDCWHSAAYQTCGDNTYYDSCARTDGKINNFDENETKFSNFVKRILKRRVQLISKSTFDGVEVHDEVIIIKWILNSSHTYGVINLGSTSKKVNLYIHNEPTIYMDYAETWVSPHSDTFTYEISPGSAEILSSIKVR